MIEPMTRRMIRRTRCRSATKEPRSCRTQARAPSAIAQTPRQSKPSPKIRSGSTLVRADVGTGAEHARKARAALVGVPAAIVAGDRSRGCRAAAHASASVRRCRRAARAEDRRRSCRPATACAEAHDEVVRAADRRSACRRRVLGIVGRSVGDVVRDDRARDRDRRRAHGEAAAPRVVERHRVRHGKPC